MIERLLLNVEAVAPIDGADSLETEEVVEAIAELVDELARKRAHATVTL